ncbi:MAG: lysine exporter LysO family protein [Candidatus Bathyarchaeia archaeon]
MIKFILAALTIGVVAGYVNNNLTSFVASNWVTDYLFSASLFVSLFVMGLSFGIDKEAVAKLRSKGLKILVVPVVVALGSILGGLIGGLILRLDIYASMAVTAGYGWYTLTGPLIKSILGTQWAAMGFAVNFLRELLTIFTVSLMVKVDKYAPIASGGATTMDTTLPVIVRYCGSDVLVTAFSSGFALSMIAPFTVVALASLK